MNRPQECPLCNVVFMRINGANMIDSTDIDHGQIETWQCLKCKGKWKYTHQETIDIIYNDVIDYQELNNQVIRPQSVKEVNEYLKAPLCHNHVVLFLHRTKNKIEYDLIFMLNPFGNGTCNTTELKLKEDFKVEKSMLKSIIIIPNSIFVGAECI